MKYDPWSDPEVEIESRGLFSSFLFFFGTYSSCSVHDYHLTFATLISTLPSPERTANPTS